MELVFTFFVLHEVRTLFELSVPLLHLGRIYNFQGKLGYRSARQASTELLEAQKRLFRRNLFIRVKYCEGKVNKLFGM